MKTLSNLFGGARKALAVCGLVAGITAAGVTGAAANSWNFSYTGSFVSVSGTFTAVQNAQNIWDITSITGTRNGSAITGLWCSICLTLQPGYGSSDNYYVDSANGAPGPGWWDPQLDIHFLVGTDKYILGYIENYNAPTATETNVTAAGGAPTMIDYPGTGRCRLGTAGCTEITDGDISPVPEVNASAGLGALGVLLGFLLILREMFVRRRGAAYGE